MDQILIDNLVVFSSIVFYLFLGLVYLLRAYKKDKAELMLAPIFSLLFVPFVSLWILSFLHGSDIGRLVTIIPMIIYLVYDLWYRLITNKKPHHHPKKWPIGLVLYIILLQIGSIGVNWYGFIVSKLYGNLLIILYFIMLGCFGFYQYRYNKKIKSVKNL